MQTEPFSGRGNSDEDRRLDSLIAHYVDRLNAGEQLDSRQVLRDHPAVGERILEELQVFLDLGEDEIHRGFDSRPLGTLGDYTLRRQIGRGGMGVVYEAWQNSVERSVALKVLPGAVAADDKAFHRFMREARAAEKLSHPNIVGVHGMGQEENTPYYAMEFVEGLTLAQVLARIGDADQESEAPFGERGERQFYTNVASAFADVADGLQHAHARGVVHRDIKPSNLILDTQARLRILDFGLARLEGQESLTLSGDFVGTPLYVSPEQARRKKIPVDHRTDIYSLGATLYEAVTGRPPFRGEDHADTLSQIIERDPPDPARINPGIPRDLETIVLKCLRKDAGDRYGTAEALAQDLRRWVRGDPVEAKPQPQWERIVRWFHRQRWHVAAGALGLLVAVGAVVLGVLYKRHRDSERMKTYEASVVQAVLQMGLDQASFLQGVGRVDRRRTEVAILSGGRITPEQRILEALDGLESCGAYTSDRVDHIYHRARGFSMLGRPQAALDELAALLASRPDFFPARALRAAILRRRGDQALADRELQIGHATAPPWGAAWFEGRQALFAEDWPRAVEAYKRLDLEDVADLFLGADFEVLMARGIARFESGDNDGAIRDFLRAVDRWPSAIGPAILIGRAYAAQKNFDEMIRWLEEYWQSIPTPEAREDFAFEVKLGLAERLSVDDELRWIGRMRPGLMRERRLMYTLYWAGRPNEAVAAGQAALRHDEEDPLTLAMLALAHTGVPGDEASARARAEEAERLMERDPYTCFVLALVHAMLGDLDGCVRFNRLALEYEPSFVRAMNNLGRVLAMQGKLIEAREVFEHAVKLDPRSPAALSFLASTYSSTGQVELARSHLDRALAINPREPVPNYELGRLSERLGNFVEAESYFRAAIDHGQGYHVPKLGLARVLLEQGRLDEALRSCCEALESSGGQARPGRLLARLLRREQRPRDLSCLDGVAEALEDRLSTGKRSPDVVEALGLALLHAPGRRDPEKAVELLREALEAKESSERRASLATALAATDRLAEAVHCLEVAVTRGARRPEVLAQLARYRVALAPDVVSFASIDALFDSAPVSGPRLETRLDAFREVAGSDGAGGRVVYFEARLLEEQRRFEDAGGVFETLALDHTGDTLAPLRRWVVCAARTGGSGAVVEFLHDALRDGNASTDELLAILWGVWTRDLDLSPERLAAELEGLDPSTAEDHRWVMGGLARGESLRLNCGGQEDVEVEGVVWSRDRFVPSGSRGGKRSREEPFRETTLGPVLSRQRIFSRHHASGYRLPLPRGRYGVTLHIAEPWYPGEGYRIFDIEVEGELRVEGCDPGRVSPDRALERHFEVEVDDGFLDLTVVPHRGEPFIGAIEVTAFDSS